MKNYTLVLLALLFALTGIKAQVTHTVSVSGFAYDPDDLQIEVNDTVVFVGDDFHPLAQVSEETWNANGNTPLDTGFAFASGSGKVDFPTAGVYYYVCTAHAASNGMKGKITVGTVTAVQDISDARPSVYPLPLRGNELTVAFRSHGQKQLEVSVYDLAGNLRITETGFTSDGLYKLDCSKLPAGLFLMKVKTDGENYVSKVVRE